MSILNSHTLNTTVDEGVLASTAEGRKQLISGWLNDGLKQYCGVAIGAYLVQDVRTTLGLIEMKIGQRIGYIAESHICWDEQDKCIYGTLKYGRPGQHTGLIPFLLK